MLCRRDHQGRIHVAESDDARDPLEGTGRRRGDRREGDGPVALERGPVLCGVILPARRGRRRLLLEEQLDVLGAVSAVTSGAAIAGDASRVRPAPQRIEAHTQEGGGVGHAQPPVSR